MNSVSIHHRPAKLDAKQSRAKEEAASFITVRLRLSPWAHKMFEPQKWALVGRGHLLIQVDLRAIQIKLTEQYIARKELRAEVAKESKKSVWWY